MEWWYYLIIGVAATLVLVAIVVLILNKSKKTKSSSSTTLQHFSDSLLLEYLGGSKNVKQLSINNQRVSIELVDIALMDVEKIKSLEISVMLLKNNVKMLIKDAKIIKELESKFGGK
jgi:phosphotransferase system IIB component